MSRYYETQSKKPSNRNQDSYPRDSRTAKQVKRNKLKSVADKAILRGDTARADRIKRNNLGKIKWDNRESSFKGRIKTIVFTATYSFCKI